MDGILTNIISLILSDFLRMRVLAHRTTPRRDGSFTNEKMLAAVL